MGQYEESQYVEADDVGAEGEVGGGDPRWRQIVVTLSLFIYLGAFAVIGGRLLAYLFPQGHETSEVHALGGEASAFELFAYDPERQLMATVREAYPFEEHGKALTEGYLKELGISSRGHSLFELSLHNLSADASVVLEGGEGLVAMTTESGKSVESSALPPGTDHPLTKLRLIQRRPTGALPPEHERSYWLLLPMKLDLKQVKSGQLRLPDGQRLDLEVQARFR